MSSRQKASMGAWLSSDKDKDSLQSTHNIEAVSDTSVSLADSKMQV